MVSRCLIDWGINKYLFPWVFQRISWFFFFSPRCIRDFTLLEFVSVAKWVYVCANDVLFCQIKQVTLGSELIMFSLNDHYQGLFLLN